MVKPHMSATQLDMLAGCPKQFEFRYVLGIKAPPGVTRHVGSGTHKGIEKNLRAKLGGWGLLSDEEVRAAAADETRRLFDEAPPQLDDDERALGIDKVRGQAVDQAAALAVLHAKQLAPKLEPVAIEEGFRVELAGFPYDLLGYIDVREPGRIRDTKTAGKSPSSGDADRGGKYGTQLTIYHLNEATQGRDADVLADVLVKTQTPKLVTLTGAKRTQMDHLRLFARLETSARVIESGVFAPADPGHWRCSARWCGYWDRCDQGAKQQVTVALIDPSKLVRPRAA